MGTRAWGNSQVISSGSPETRFYNFFSQDSFMLRGPGVDSNSVRCRGPRTVLFTALLAAWQNPPAIESWGVVFAERSLSRTG
jgi:hypothetical protein